MSDRSWRSTGKFGSSLALLLLGTLALSGILVYQAQDAMRSHREASESALSDYAAFASWELAGALGSELGDLPFEAYDAHYAAGLDRGGGATRLREYAREVRHETAGCGCPEAILSIFYFDLSGGSLEVLESPLPRVVLQWVSDSLALVAASPAAPPPTDAPHRLSRSSRDPRRADVRLSSGFPGAPDLSLMYSVVRGQGGEPRHAYGFVVDVSRFAAAWTRQIIATAPLLPPSLTGNLGNEDLLSISLAFADREPFYQQDAAVESEIPVVDHLPTPFGPIAMRVAVRPEVADELVIGGLPRSRLPLLLGIFFLTLGLGVTAIVQLRREQELVRLRGGFIASVSHELRTPLAQIRLFSDLLKSGRLREEQQQRSVRIINEEAQRLTYLVENVLRFSRSEQHLDRVSPQPTPLGTLVREIVSAFAPLAAAQDIDLQVEMAEDVVSRVDRDAFRQVLLNLLDNAVKYGRRGQTVVVGLEREGDRVRVRVDDQGPGIAPSDRAGVWEPYRRLQRGVEATTGGSGIGLAVVRDLVELHGGGVAVHSSPGGGARFVVWFPAEPAAATDTPPPRLVEQGVGGRS